ncbi:MULTISPECIES: hypothetical protein [unclassified Nodularia (in: cyanobacteria)]|uniref:hypothetical protein n=1 Tax=unclassified Nodularia (in: cyanobacteria) TaxID=2656917 RepID=UPI001D121FC5|nr:hypothetical protein [Nodularia sp. LEGE 04288]MCC2693011.1 hypothetical protein [Nodularia sp. LEGE 04288]
MKVCSEEFSCLKDAQALTNNSYQVRLISYVFHSLAPHHLPLVIINGGLRTITKPPYET